MGELSHTIGGDSNLVSFKSAARVPITSLKAHFKPKQDLHGYSKPWPAGGGNNIWDEEWEIGSIDTNTGLPITENNRIRSKNYIPVTPDTSYYFLTAAKQFVCFMYDENQTILVWPGETNNYKIISNATFTTSSDAKYLKFYCTTSYGTIYNHDISINYPSSVTTYSPYENICPIEGWNQCDIWHEPMYIPLPNEYQRVEYLATSQIDPKKSKIKTGIIGNNKTIVIKYAMTKRVISGSYPTMIVSSYQPNDASSTPCSPWAAVYYEAEGGNNVSLATITPIQGNINIPNTYTVKFYSTNNYILCGGWSDNYWTKCGKYYSFTIYDNNTIVFNGIPCYRKLDEMPGLFDVVSNSFFTSDNIDDFTCGPDVELDKIHIDFPITGKNKFDPNCSMWNRGVYIKNGDEITQTGSDGRGWTNSNYPPIHLPAGTYTVTCSDGNVLTVGTSIDNYANLTRLDNGGGTFTLSEDCYVKIKHSASSYPTTFTVQLELGDTATAYEPYSSDNTVYGGYIDIVKGEIVATYAYHTLNGTETKWTIDGGGSSKRAYTDTVRLGNVAKAKGKLYCNYCKTGSSGLWYGWISSSGSSSSCHVLFYIPVEIDTEDKWKAYLSEHPLDICYELNSPIHYPIPKKELKTFLNQNNIWSNTNDITEVSYAIHDSAPIRAAKQRIAAFNARKIADFKNILRSNYLPNGATWVDEVDIDFDAGDYIEASIDLSSCTGVAENILSIGTVIDTWAVANSSSHVSGTEDIAVHFYYPASSGTTKLANDLSYTAVADGTETKHSRNLDKITLSDTTLIIKIDYNNVYVNGTAIITGSLIYTAQTIFQAKTKLLVGSLEGSNRSHATYNYIKVVRGQ